MKLWLLTQNQTTGYDTYDSCIVAAESEDKAKEVNPDGDWKREHYHCWAITPDRVKAEYIGEAKEGTEAGVILASFNAG